MHILRSQQFSEAELLKYAQSLSAHPAAPIEEQLLHWDFGPVMNLSFDSMAKNYLFSKERVPLHWDGAFYKEPRMLLFYCETSSGVGGETFFVDTNRVWKILPQRLKEMCELVQLTYRTEKVAHYGGEIKVRLLQNHPLTGEKILRLAERVTTSLNPVELEIEGVDDPDAFYDEMMFYLYSEEAIYYHTWRPGDLLIVDNFQYLHGRQELKTNLKRSFKRIQIL